MRVLVTGATGKVGYAIASALLDRGDPVRALVRDPNQAASILPAGIEPLRGDATGRVGRRIEDDEPRLGRNASSNFFRLDHPAIFLSARKAF